jgi:hypothetical protein
MNTETFKEWLRAQGHQVVSTPSSCWYDAGPRVFQAFPFHWIIEPSRQELRSLMVRHAIAALRYSTPLESPEGMVSYHVILKPPYSLEMLPHQARNGVKRGAKCFQVEQISFERLADEGWKLQCDTLDRQCRSDSMCQADWKRICMAAKDLPGFEAWAAISDGELAAALYTNRVGDTWCIPYALCHRKFLHDHVNNILFYTVCRELLSRQGIKGMFLSLHSLDAPESVNEFKFRMGFTAIPVRQRVVFHPALAPFTNKFTHSVLTRLMQRYPKNNFLSKTEGMLRFHVLGKMSLADQIWPESVSQYKSSPGGEISPLQPEAIPAQSAEI